MFIKSPVGAHGHFNWMIELDPTRRQRETHPDRSARERNHANFSRKMRIE